MTMEPGTVPARPNRTAWQRIKKWFLARPGAARLVVILMLFIAWEIAARFFVDKIFLSPPSIVFTSLHTVFETNGVPRALEISASEILSTR